MLGKDIDIPDVKPPSGDSVLDGIVNFCLGNGYGIAVVIVAIVAIIAIRALGGAVSSIIGKLTVPIGVAAIILLFYGATKLM